MKYYKITETGYPSTYEGKEAEDGYKEFTVTTNEDGTVTYEPKELDDAIKAEEAKAEAERLYAEAKAIKTEALNSIVVTGSTGKSFDGNESARTNMLSAIQVSDILGVVETEWKLADNSVVPVTVNELKEALALSIQEVGRIVKE